MGVLEVSDQVDVGGSCRAHEADPVGELALVDAEEAGDVVLDVGLVDDVGCFEADLWQRAGVVVADLDGQGREVAEAVDGW